MKLKPLFDKIVIKQENPEEKTKSGILLPTQAQEKQQIGVVLAVGAGGIVDGKEINIVVSVGDKVLYSKYAGTDFKLDGEEVTILRQSDVLAIIE
ncbi:MAG: co-chaperone GroES [Bacillota bacterium]